MRASTPTPAIIALDLCGPVAGIAKGAPGKAVASSVPARRLEQMVRQLWSAA